MRLAHTMIRVRDLDETLAFYTGFLGLREVRRKPIGDEATLVFLTDESERYHIELTCNHDGRDYTLGDQFGHLAFHTDDLERRVSEHKAGMNCAYTTRRLPVALVFSQDFQTRDDAFEAEHRIKGWTRRKKQALIRGDLDELVRLSNHNKKAARPSTSSG